MPDPAPRLDHLAWFATFAGLCGSLVGIGLARFAYTPLIPSLIEAHWFTAADTVTLGAANFAGYLAGALLGRSIAKAIGNRAALRISMLFATAAFFACAWPLSISWFFVWRFISGLTGGAIMVLVATTILPHIPMARRGFVSGMIFLGIGAGIAASGTLVPTLMQFGLRTTWIGLGLISLALTALSWFGWPAINPPMPEGGTTNTKIRGHKLSLWLLYTQYSANALGVVPVMILLVDYIARGLGRGASMGAEYWVLYGLAAMVGPIFSGVMGDLTGFRRAYRLSLALQAISAIALVISDHWLVIGGATIVFGLFTPGMVTLALGRIQEILPHDHDGQRIAWSNATTGFALFQMLGGYAYAWLFAQTDGDYALIFLIAAGALVLGVCVNVGSTLRDRRLDRLDAHPAG
jgi:MFS family permease